MRTHWPHFFRATRRNLVPLVELFSFGGLSMISTAQMTHLHSDAFEELIAFCRNITSPVTDHDLSAFVAIYLCLKPKLSPEEEKEAEGLIERLSPHH